MNRSDDDTRSIRPSPSRLLRGWTLLWCVLAVLQVTQAIWLQRGGAVPGGMSDARFNHHVLEHGWLALCGAYEWASPAQFFPAPATLALSETHAGTLPLYVAARALGLAPDSAWQLWFVALAALNVWAAVRVLRAIGLPAAWRGPVAFAMTASPAMVWITGNHAQLLPLFPAWFALEQGVRWAEDRAPHRLAAGAGWLAWQFAASPYAAFFCGVLGGALTVAFGLARLGRSRASEVADVADAERTDDRRGAVNVSPANSARLRDWLGALAILVPGGSLAGAALSVYLRTDAPQFAKTMIELPALAPRVGSWFTAPPTNLFWAAGSPGGATDLVEHGWFCGPGAWLIAAVACIAGWRTRRTGGAWMFALSGGALLAVLFFTRWSEALPGAWLWCAEHVPALRSFRAAGRVAVLIHPLLVAASALFLAQWSSGYAAHPGQTAQRASRRSAPDPPPSRRGHRARFVPLLLGAWLIGENLAGHQPTLRFADVEAREAPLVAAWRAAGDRPRLAYAPGYTNHPTDFLHLDAWGAALRLRRATLNGYSGRAPELHLLFILNPTPERARELMHRAGIDPATVSLVESPGAEAERAIQLERSSERGTFSLEGFELQPTRWRMDIAPVRFEVGGAVFYQFTPPSELSFVIPDGARQLEFNFAMRDGSWNGPGASDGVEVTWTLTAAANGSSDVPGDRSGTGSTPARSPDESGRTKVGETALFQEWLNPRDRHEHRGVLARVVKLPPGRGRVVMLRTHAGPAGHNWWDWPLFGQLRVRE